MANRNFIGIMATAIVLLLSLYAFTDSLFYTITKKVSNARIVKLDRSIGTNVYRATLVYHNEYTQSLETVYINNIDETYASNLKMTEGRKIFYRKYFPNEVYFRDYKAPTITGLIWDFIFFIFMLIGLIISFKKRNEVEKQA